MYKIYKRGGEGVQKSYTRTDAIAYYLKLFGLGLVKRAVARTG